MQTIDEVTSHEESPLAALPSAAEVRHQLEQIVNSVHFRSSRRYPALLRYIVEETLAGRGDQLKERTLGIEVFGRHHDYDTNLDPVVRVTVGKIRQRLAQYYSEPGREQELHFRLHLGSYMPHFEYAAADVSTLPAAPAYEAEYVGLGHRADSSAAHLGGTLPARDLKSSALASPLSEANIHMDEAEPTPAMQAESHSGLDPLSSAPVHTTWHSHVLPVKVEIASPTPEPQRQTSHPLASKLNSGTVRRARLSLAIASAAALCIAVPLLLLLRHQQHVQAGNKFWEPLLVSEQPLLFVLGVHSLDEHGVDTPEHLPMQAATLPAPTVLDAMTRTEMVSLNDAISYSDIVSMITRQHHQVRTLAASTTSLEQLRQGPVVLLGGFNNPWTLRLTSPLRYHFVALSDSMHLIQDARNPSVAWHMDTQESAVRSERDYAIIARFQDSQIDQPVLVAAGIGKSGTEAAAEFLTTKSYLQTWLTGTHKPASGNIEIVIETDLINGQHGAPHVVASDTW